MILDLRAQSATPACVVREHPHRGPAAGWEPGVGGLLRGGQRPLCRRGERVGRSLPPRRSLQVIANSCSSLSRHTWESGPFSRENRVWSGGLPAENPSAGLGLSSSLLLSTPAWEQHSSLLPPAWGTFPLPQPTSSGQLLSFQIRWKWHLLQEAFPDHTLPTLTASPLCSCSFLCR